MRARTSGVPKVTTAMARRAIISGPARLRMDSCPLNVPPGADGGQPGRIRQRAGPHRLSKKKRPGPPLESPGLPPRSWTASLRRAAAATQEDYAEERQQEPRALRARGG